MESNLRHQFVWYVLWNPGRFFFKKSEPYRNYTSKRCFFLTRCGCFFGRWSLEYPFWGNHTIQMYGNFEISLITIHFWVANAMAVLRRFLKGCIFDLWFPGWTRTNENAKPSEISGVLLAGCEVQVYWTLMCEVRWLDDSVLWDMNLNQQQTASHNTVMNAKKTLNGSWIKWIYFSMPAPARFLFSIQKIGHCILFRCLHSWSQLFLWVEQWHVNMLMIHAVDTPKILFWSSISTCQVEKGL